MKHSYSHFILCCLVLIAASASAATTYSHQEYFEHYEGTKTCLECHGAEAETFFHSQHYQWRGDAPNVANAEGKKLGKMNTINDFCTSPQANWIGVVTSPSGKMLSEGCSKCHAGFGLLPEETMSQAQLENIDCLICHASGYRRSLFEDENGNLVRKPILWKNQEGLDSVSKRISLPKNAMCLRCHSASGGGPNWKRGDIEYELAECDREHDVHMAEDGAGLNCVDCHAGEDHRVVGRGADLSATDTPGEILRCEKCHDTDPHAEPLLNKHAARVDCTVCHIPRFAKVDPTDMDRDWSKPHYNDELEKYEATIVLASNQVPTYAWYNGNTKAQLPATPAMRNKDGLIEMMVPLGNREDAASKIHAFKVHKGRLPVLAEKDWIIPIVVEEFFADGDIDKAVRNAAEEMYGVADAKYTWNDTIRYMGIFHGVEPAENALECLDCHGVNGRISWKDLGYEKDPLSKCFDE